MLKKSEITKILLDPMALKPDDFLIDELKWKYLLWSVLKGKNVLITGPTRSGKTRAVHSVVSALNRKDKFFYFNMGSSQDARALLVGNTFYKKETGTVFNPSEFVKAISTEDAIILLDEFSRGSHDMHNILMPVIDTTQRYLRLDETEHSDIISVAKGVTFIATANIGSEYTATRVLDKASMARFPIKIEMEPLSKDEELKLIGILHPNTSTVEQTTLISICDIASHTRLMAKNDDSKIDTFISTGAVLEMAELVVDGFSLVEIAEVSIYPEYSNDGGVDSERTYMKQLVQKHIDVSITSPAIDPTKKVKGSAKTFTF